MSSLVRLSAIAAAVALAVPAAAPLAAQQSPAAAPRPMGPMDIAAWRSVRQSSLGSDGKWLAYVIAPNEGDGEVVIREVAAGGRETRYPVGDVSSGSGASLQMSQDGKWLAFMSWPKASEQEQARKARRPIQGKANLVNLATGAHRTFENVRSIGFGGQNPEWVAFQAAPAGGAAPAPAAGGATPSAGATAGRATGTDLLLHKLGTEIFFNVGNVAEFSFDHTGRWLVYVIDAGNRLGNGIQLRDMQTGTVRSIDAAERSWYRRLAWYDTLPAFTAYRGSVDSAGKDTSYAVIGLTGVGGRAERLVVMRDDREDWPDGMAFSVNRSPRWTAGLDGLVFGIQEAPPEKKPATLEDDDKPTLRLWHTADERLQSQQQVQETSDRNFSYLAVYWPGTDRVIRLNDSSARSASLVGDDRWVLTTDVSRYQRQASLDGINRSDVHLVDPRTGRKRTFGTDLRSGVNVSPDGRWGAWFQDGEWHLQDLASGTSRTVTSNEQFVNRESDHNQEKPARPFYGWSADGSAFLLSDGWDIWRVNVAGGAPVNMTGDGAGRGIRYQRPMTLDFRARGHDLTKPLIVAAREERSKREATFRLDPRGNRLTTMFDWRDARVSPMKARDAEVWIATLSSADRFPDFWLMGTNGDTTRLSDASPDMQGLAWSSGVRLITYVSDKGDTLQGALHLPANYEEGKSYPTIVYIYEKMSDGLHTFSNPTFSSSYTPSIYTSRGYAVYQPDIRYTINDPGMSAVWAVLPAMRAAAATGIVDSTRVGLHGHSWGGYQTAFLVTQTPYFRAAVAGAPLTDMISMYSSVYWNSGSANQPIFQSSQGRFRGNFIENREAYERNSPNRFADRITTPLIILHNDKDGAVDYNQGITFFNTLRQLGKDVILLEYTGENHGLSQLKNRRDYTIRLMEFWDHHLKGEPAPAWLERGVPRLEFEDHLRERRSLYKPAAPEKKEPEKKEETIPPPSGPGN